MTRRNSRTEEVDEATGEENRQSRGQTGRPSWHHSPVFRFLGLGSELAGFTLVFAGVGYAIDSTRGHSKPYATAFGALIGFTFAMVRFIQQVRRNDGN